MSETFKNFKEHLTVSTSTIYTCPPDKTAILLMLQVSNSDGEYVADANVSWTDSSDLDETSTPIETVLLKNAVIPVGSALSAVAGKMVLEAGDTIKASASADNAVTISGSILELA
jgi:hypothetical protein